MAGRGLATVGTILNTRLIVISGALAAAGDLLISPMRASYSKYTLVKPGDVDNDLPVFVVGKFLENDSCLGAVGLVLRHHGRLA